MTETTTLASSSVDKTSTGRQLSYTTYITYSVPTVGVSFLYVLMIVMYMKFAVDEIGLAASLVGAIFLLSKVWDAISDPIAGYLSDRTESRWGRRHSWMLMSAPLILLFSLMLWAPPAMLEGTALTLWVAVAIFGFYTAFTVFEVPNLALGAELTQRYEDRNRIFGARQLAKSIGFIIALVGGTAIMQGASDRIATAGWLMGIAGTITLILIFVSVLKLPPERADYRGRGSQNPFSAMRDVWMNPHARLLLFVYFIEFLGVGGVSTLSPFLSEYVIKQPASLPVIMAAYSISIMLSVPLWVWFGNRFEKKHVWMVAMMVAALGFAGLYFVSEGAVVYTAICFAVAGLGNGCANVLGQSLKADIVDYDELKTGERKEGAYFAAWNFMHKLGLGLMMGAVGISLDLAGFVPKAQQSETVIMVILVLIGAVPCVSYIIGLLAFTRFKLNRASHEVIRQALQGRA